jgi:hypothetical protein
MLIPKSVAGLVNAISKDREQFNMVYVSKNKAVGTDAFSLVQIEYEQSEGEYPVVNNENRPEEVEGFLLSKDAVLSLSKTKPKKSDIPVLEEMLGVVEEQKDDRIIVSNTDLTSKNTVVGEKAYGYWTKDKVDAEAFMIKEPKTTKRINLDLLKKIVTTLDKVTDTKERIIVEITADEEDNSPLCFTAKTQNGETIKALILPVKRTDQ